MPGGRVVLDACDGARRSDVESEFGVGGSGVGEGIVGGTLRLPGKAGADMLPSPLEWTMSWSARESFASVSFPSALLWFTFLIVSLACLYACRMAKPTPETDWIAERKNMARVWNESCCEVRRCKAGRSDRSSA